MTPGPTAAWLREERAALLALASASRVADGFGWLDDRGAPDPARGVHLWITCRMTHVGGLAVLERLPGAEEVLDHGVRSLRAGALRDRAAGGWFGCVAGGEPGAAGVIESLDKEAYGHAFVVLAAATAVRAGHPDAPALLAEALDVVDEHFWDEAAGMARESFDRGWERSEDYRGVNANMHLVEALLAAHDATGERTWLQRADRITRRVVRDFAAPRGYRLPEHFSAGWEPLLDHHRDRPDHPFRPYGVTVGHLLEWSRLVAHLAAADPATAEAWWPDAAALFDRAVADGWAVDGAPGFVYTTDFDGRPVVTTRLHWVVAEALGAAAVLHRTLGGDEYAARHAAWWDYARTFLVDADGSWRHELDDRNRPAATVWSGRPDVYHAYQAALLPEVGSCTALAGGAADRFGAAGR